MRLFLKNARTLTGSAAGLTLALMIGWPAFSQDAQPGAAPQGLTENVVAEVNDDVITNYDIIQRMRLLVVTAGIQPTRDDMPELQRYALSSLIDERLEMQELRREEKEQKTSIVATDSVVDDTISDYAKQNHMTADQFLTSLAQQGIGPDTLRAQLRAQESWQDWIRGRYGSRLRIGEDQIKAFQARMAAEANKPKYEISEVFLDAGRAGGMQQAMDQANQLVNQLHQGAQFQAVARQFSASATAANGGDAGWVTAGELDPQVREAVDNLRPGSLSAPIQTKDGVYIILLRERQAGGSAVLISLKQAAIALPADAPQDQVDAARAKLEALRGQLHGCEKFEAIAGKTDGVLAGDLGEAEAKDLAPAFRDAALALPVGAISEPIRSDQGLHLLAVCNKRSNAAQGLNHDQIENRLIGEQLQMINKRYIRDLRNSASIEVRTAQAGELSGPPLAVSLGEPAGVGPEIVAAAWRALRADGPRFFVVGDAATLAAAGAPVAAISGPDEADARFADALPVLDVALPKPATPGSPSPDAAASVVRWIETAVALALAGNAAGVVTAPISKAALYGAGFEYPGHTEFIGALTAASPMPGARGPVMMLTARDLRVALVTVHEPLARVPALVTEARIAHVGQVVAEALRRDFGVEAPRLVVAGLNPHAGEGGTIGREEETAVAPAVAALRRRGVDARGPLPADSLFHDAARATYDAAICLYHDQALIPVKMLDFWGGVNLTLGLPIVRTSPDHGTAFDIAGKGVARPDSLIAAIRLAAEIAGRRRAA